MSRSEDRNSGAPTPADLSVGPDTHSGVEATVGAGASAGVDSGVGSSADLGPDESIGPDADLGADATGGADWRVGSDEVIGPDADLGSDEGTGPDADLGADASAGAPPAAVRAPDPPEVSILIPTCNGRHLLDPCLRSLAEVDYPRERFAVLVWDNGSSDGTREWLAAEHPHVRVLAASRNDGFAAPCNRLAAAAGTRRVCLLNDDARVAPDFLRALVEAQEKTGAACVGARILSGDGARIEFDGGSMSVFGHGAPLRFGEPAEAHAAEAEPFPSLFACGAAMLLDRDVFLSAGGFDEGYFAYYEDVDLGWRLWVLGESCVIAPAARIYHREHGSEGVLPAGRRLALLERNALIGVAKNYEEERAGRVLRCALALLGERARLAADPARRRACGEGLVAAIEGLPAAEDARAALRARRRRSDAEIAHLFAEPWRPAIAGDEYARRQRELAAVFGAGDLFPVDAAGGARAEAA